MIIKISEQIAPHFHNSFNCKKTHQIFSGGRGSTKTSRNCRRIALSMLEEDNCFAIGIRRYSNTIRQSNFAEMKEALNSFGAIEGTDYIANVSPMKIQIVGNGNTMYFGGLDDYNKLKGMIASRDIDNEIDRQNIDKIIAQEQLQKLSSSISSKAQVKYVLISEMNEIQDEEYILQTVATFSRGQKNYFCVLYEYNPPKNKFHWVNRWTEEMSKREDTLVHHSDYRTVPKTWLGDIFIQQAEELKKIDEERYNHIYLGHVTGIEGLIYNFDLFTIIDRLEDGERIIDFDMYIDGGHQTSSTTYLAFARTNKKRIVLLDTYFYNPKDKQTKKAPSQYAVDLSDFRSYIAEKYNTNCDTMIIDSAEGALRNEYFLLTGNRLKGVGKGTNEDMWDNVQSLLAQGRVCILNNSNNQIFIIEHKNYEYKEGSVEACKPEANKTEKDLKREINGKYYNTHSKSYSNYYADHTCDAFKYGVWENKRKYGLKF
jgi:phage terminase large subunit